MLSLVIPVFNEVDSLDALHREIADVARDEKLEIEVIFVDDGSNDGSWNEISRIAGLDPRVRGIRFRRNFGKAAALSAGFHAAHGELMITLDADLQDDPREIPRFLSALGNELDVVSGWKQTRHDPWHKVWPSRVFNAMVSRMTGVHLHDHNCGMKCYRREIFREVRLYGELHRFVPVLAHARGFKVGEIAIHHRPRKFGQSKYGVRRIVKGFLDLLTVKFLTGFGQRPQHLLGTCGLACFSLGVLGMSYMTVYWLLRQLNPSWGWEPVHDRPLLLYSLGALLLGAQLMSIGFLAELITAYQGRDCDTYSIAEETPPAEAAVEQARHERSA